MVVPILVVSVEFEVEFVAFVVPLFKIVELSVELVVELSAVVFVVFETSSSNLTNLDPPALMKYPS